MAMSFKFYWNNGGKYMTETPVQYKSFIPLYIILFIITIIWTYVGIDLAQYKFVVIYDSQNDWILLSSLLIVSMIPPIAITGILISISFMPKPLLAISLIN